MADFELVVITVHDTDGVEGLGYTYTVGRGGSAILAILRDVVIEALRGADAEAVGANRLALEGLLHWGGRVGPTTLALSAVDMALWDLLARRAGKPLWRLLGGHDPRVKGYAGGIDLLFTVDELRRQADAFLNQGLRAIKMKVGRPTLREDVARVEAMRRHLGEDFPLMADANMAWRVHEAVAAAKALHITHRPGASCCGPATWVTDDFAGCAAPGWPLDGACRWPEPTGPGSPNRRAAR